MNSGMNSAFAFGLAFVLALVLTPLTRRFAKKVGAMCYPNSRSIHKIPVRTSAVAIYLASIMAMVAVRPDKGRAFPAVAIGGLILVWARSTT